MSTNSSTSGTPAQALTTISGGINRLKTKGGADRNSLFDLLNGYVTQSNTVKVRPGTWRNADIANYSGAGNTKGLMSYQGALHVFSASVVDVPPGYELHVLNYPSAQNSAQAFTITEGQFAGTTQIGSGSGYGLVSSSYGFAVNAIINPQPGSDVGSASPTTAFGTEIAGFFQAIGSSTHDPGEVYVVFAASPALPPNGVSVTYTSTSGPVTVNLTLSMITDVLALGTNYVVYALGTGAIASDPNFASVSLLLPLNGANGGTSFPDTSVNTYTMTLTGTVVTSTAHSEFGGSSGHFTAGQLNTPITGSGPLDIGLGDWTIECWIYCAAQSAVGGVAHIVDVDAKYILYLGNGSTGALNVAGVGGGEYTAYDIGSNGLFNTWVAVAVVCESNIITTYINGVAEGVGLTCSGRASLTSGYVTIGGQQGSSNDDYVGYLQDVRITKGLARYSTTYTPAGPFGVALAPSFFNAASYPIKEIHFSAPYLGGIYVVAEFYVPSALEASNGSVAHYWIQSSTGSDNSDTWKANTDHLIGDIVIPTVPNGLTYVASRAVPANPIWTPDTLEVLGNIVEPTIANGFKYTITAVEGANPSTGETEPTWPVSDGAVVQEFSSVSNDQTVTIATPALGSGTPTVPPRYAGLYVPPTAVS